MGRLHNSFGIWIMKYGWLSASRTEIRWAGSNVSSLLTRSRNWRFIISVGVMISCVANVYQSRNGQSHRTLTCKLRHARTSFLLCLLAFGFGQLSLLPSLKYSGLLRAPARANRSGILPMTCSIMARCSRLSCVWKRATPV